MSLRSTTAGKATVFTDRLAGATLIELLDAAEEDCWPSSQCESEWELLRNWAMQTETLMVDEAENLSWEKNMRELAHRDLPYAEWVKARGLELSDRLRTRKLAQTRLRYMYGFKQPRRHGLVRRDVRELYRRWSSGAVDQNSGQG